MNERNDMDDYGVFQHLSVVIDDGLATLRFKPAEVEDFEHSMFTDIRDVFVPLSRDPGVSAVVLAVEPPRTSTIRFGQLITKATLEQRAGRFLTIQQVFTALTTFRKPIVAGVSGLASGIIAVLALLCDSVVASEGAEFADGHVGIGLAAGDGGTVLWPVLVGPGLARQILLDDRRLSAAEAAALGLVSQVVSDDALLSTAAEVASRLSRQPRVAFMATKLAINNHFRVAALFSSDLAAAYEAATVVEPEFVRSRAAGAEPAEEQSPS